MKTSPILLGASLMFWGWQTGYMILAAVMALVLEGSRLIKLKWDFSQSDFNRISDLCNLIFLGMVAYIFLSKRSASAILVLLQWVPIALFPLLIFQVYSTSDRIDISAIFLIVRKRRAKRVEKTPIAINLTYPYFAVCILSASAANVRNVWFFIILFFLSAWALWPIRSGRYSPILWISLFCLAGFGGYWGHVGLHNLQLTLEKRGLEWFSDFIKADADPYRNRTAIGDIGELKLSDRILFRVKPEFEQMDPLLLREASYNKYKASGWFAFRAKFVDVQTKPGGIIWDFQNSRNTDKIITVSTYLHRGQGMLKLPNGTFQVEQLPVLKVQQNQYGAIKVEEGPGLLKYQVRFGRKTYLDNPPDKVDLLVPENEAPALSRIVQELGLNSKPAREILKNVDDFFQQKFQYSLVQKKQKFSTTPLGEFLLLSRSGHCEYFATATVLLLRKAGIPARYASGYSVQEFSRLENRFVVRERHAHAWALAFIDGKWQDFDTTPSSWINIEQDAASRWESVYDIWSWCVLKLSEWRWQPDKKGVTKYFWLILIPFVLILVKKLHSKKRVKRIMTDQEHKSSLEHYPGIESQFYLIEKRLNELGFSRYHWETLSSWIKRIKESHPSYVATKSFGTIVALHYRLRFDPKGITKKEKTMLESNVRSWMKQNEKIGSKFS